MTQLEKITIAPGLTFDARVAGEMGAPLVLLLHGFAESMNCWRAQAAALAAAGYRAVAPSQRGYSPGARPERKIRPDTSDTANYHIERLMDDAMAIVAACGYGDRRFHLAGHDWGGSISWALADRFPQRLASLTVLCRGRIRTPSIARCKCPTEIRRDARGTTKPFLSRMQPMVAGGRRQALRERLASAGVPAASRASAGRTEQPIGCWRTTPGNCASGWPWPASPPAVSRSILTCSATRRRWKPDWPGIVREARSVTR